ncbi:MAG: ABC transporter substrate-binding protein [Fibrobacterota bacterium]
MTPKSTDTVAQILTDTPAAAEVFSAFGLGDITTDAARRTMGKRISLKQLLSARNIDYDTFTQQLAVVTGSAAENSRKDLKVTGVLPCPVKLPMMEKFDSRVAQFEQETGLTVENDLRAASMGLGFIEETLSDDTTADELPDLFVSAGFDFFFNQQGFGRFRRAGVFTDCIERSAVNSSFDGLDLQDPRGAYTIIGAVPAVFMVNLEELGDRAVPRTWEDILTEEFTDSISLPVGDFDLFNAILLSLRYHYGRDALRKLGRSMQGGLHPSQMVEKARRQTEKPAVTIMPWFFTKTVRNLKNVEVVWPADGAVLSPIFMAVKAEKAEQLQPLAEFFASREIGEILSHRGLFPSLHPDVDNDLPAESPFLWLGWDRIEAEDMGAEIAAAVQIFSENQETKGAQK